MKKWSLTNRRESALQVQEQSSFAVPVVSPSGQSAQSNNAPISPPPIKYNPLGTNTAAKQYRGNCGSCGQNKTIPNTPKTL